AESLLWETKFSESDTHVDTSSPTDATPSGKTSELGRNVEAAAIKAELDVKARASQMGQDMNETAFVDDASTVDKQLSARRNDEHPNLMDHIREDLRQTEEDIQYGVEQLKEAVFGAEEPAPKTKDEDKKWFAQTSVLGRNVEAAAIKAELDVATEHTELDVKARPPQRGKDMNETAKKAYDNVVDGAATVDHQLSASHAAAHGHDHSRRDTTTDDEHHPHLMDHVREDLRQTKEDIQHGVEQLKETVFGAEETAHKAKDEDKKWWASKTKTEHLDNPMNAGLSKAGEKLREMDDREARDSEAEFWIKTEQRHQRQQRRESGRAM
ncbi:hypothetical protein BGZ65_005379, partial [Modicella reniformis]